MVSLYIIGELDGKITKKKPILEILKKRTHDEIANMSDFLYDLYIPPSD